MPGVSSAPPPEASSSANDPCVGRSREVSSASAAARAAA